MIHPGSEEQPFRVFGTLWISGQAARHGLNPYLGYPLTWRVRAFGTNSPTILDANLNPPSMLPVFSLWSRIPLRSAALGWATISTFLFIVTFGVLIHRYRPERKQVWWVLTCAATVTTLNVQQIYALLLVLGTSAWILLETEQDIAAGICFGVLTAIKPNLALWPIFLWLAGRRKPVLPAAIATTILSIVPLWLYGRAIYSEWLHAAGIDTHWIFPVNVSIVGNLTRVGSRSAGVAIAVAVLIALCCLVWATKPPIYETTGIAICAAILCAPLSWLNYLLLLAPLLLSRRWTAQLTVATIFLWLNPAFVNPSSEVGHWSLFFRGLVYFIPICILLVEYCRPSLRVLAARWQPRYTLSPARDGQ